MKSSKRIALSLLVATVLCGFSACRMDDGMIDDGKVNSSPNGTSDPIHSDLLDPLESLLPHASATPKAEASPASSASPAGSASPAISASPAAQNTARQVMARNV